MIQWSNLPLDPTDTGIIENLQGVTDTRSILVAVTEHNQYLLNVVDTDTNNIVYNGNTDNLLSLLNALQTM